MDPQEKAFLSRLKDEELDHETRMVYADWLEDHDRPEEADRQRRYVPSRKWLTEFAKEYHVYGQYHNWSEEEAEGVDRDGTPIGEVIEEYYKDFLEYLKGHVGKDRDGNGWFGFDLPYDFDAYSDEMWSHFEVVTGLKAPDFGEKARTQMPGHFRCSC